MCINLLLYWHCFQIIGTTKYPSILHYNKILQDIKLAVAELLLSDMTNSEVMR
jgi:hypothetical protein